jgi:hypothetical protein
VVGGGHSKGKKFYILKTIELSTPKLYILVPGVKKYQMVCKSLPFREVPSLLKQECPKILKTVDILAP